MDVLGGRVMEISECLKKCRQKTNITQEHLADKLGVTRQTISSWETGRSYPDIASIVKMSEIFNMSLDELLKEHPKLKKQNNSKIKTIAFGKLAEGEIEHTENYVEQIVEKINNILK